MSPRTVYRLINTALAAAGMRDSAGQPLAWRPHDFRRCFATEAVTGGLPVHIAARLLGHKNLATTESYTAVFQDDLIRSYRCSSTNAEPPGQPKNTASPPKKNGANSSNTFSYER